MGFTKRYQLYLSTKGIWYPYGKYKTRRGAIESYKVTERNYCKSDQLKVLMGKIRDRNDGSVSFIGFL